MSETIKEAAATYDDLLKLPEHLVGEIVAGELWASPRPAAPHARSSSIIGSEIIGAFDRGRGGPGGWWILFEPELHLGNDVLVPDVAGWRRTRMPQIPNVAFFAWRRIGSAKSSRRLLRASIERGRCLRTPHTAFRIYG